MFFNHALVSKLLRVLVEEFAEGQGCVGQPVFEQKADECEEGRCRQEGSVGSDNQSTGLTEVLGAECDGVAASGVGVRGVLESAGGGGVLLSWNLEDDGGWSLGSDTALNLLHDCEDAFKHWAVLLIDLWSVFLLLLLLLLLHITLSDITATGLSFVGNRAEGSRSSGRYSVSSSIRVNSMKGHVWLCGCVAIVRGLQYLSPPLLHDTIVDTENSNFWWAAQTDCATPNKAAET